MVKGYVIQDRNGQYLDRFFKWREHIDATEAYVHTAKSLELNSASNWALQAETAYEAQYDPEGGHARLTGEAIGFYLFAMNLAGLVEQD